MSLAWREFELLAPYTTLHVGGAARYFTTVTTTHELEETVARAQALELPFVVLGGGSNVLVPDTGYEGLVIVMGISGVAEVTEGASVLVTAAAGEVFDEVVSYTTTRGYWGLENLSHIPGTVGATPIQNVGAYGVEVADIIVSVTVYDTHTHGVCVLENSQCDFGYRTSRFKVDALKRYVVLSVTFRLSREAAPRVTYADLAGYFPDSAPTTPDEVRQAIIAIRSAKFPDWHTVGTAGSFFKNPIVPLEEAEALRARYPELPCYPQSATHVKCSLGYLLDKVCGLRGYAVGSVRLYEAQALVLVAERGATAEAIDDFATMVAAHVYQKTGITIEREVQTLQKRKLEF